MNAGRDERFRLKITNSLVLLDSKWHHAEKKKDTCLPICSRREGFHSGLKLAAVPASPLRDLKVRCSEQVAASHWGPQPAAAGSSEAASWTLRVRDS